MIEGVIGVRQRRVGRVHGGFGSCQAIFTVRQSRLARLEVELPACHLLRECGVGLRKIGQLGAQSIESRARGLMFFRQPSFAIVRDLDARLGLRFLDLRSGASLTRRFLRMLGHGHRIASTRDGPGPLGERLVQCTTFLIEPGERFAKLVSPARQSLREGVSFLDLAVGALPAPIELALPLRGSSRFDLRSLERCSGTHHEALRFLDGCAERVRGCHRFLPRSTRDR
jgi:hypothetical protein